MPRVSFGTVRGSDRHRSSKFNLEIAEEWFPLEQEAWQRLEREEQAQDRPTRAAAKSTSRRSTRNRARNKKTRPALVIQNDVSNEYSSTTIVTAITSRVNTPAYPNEAVIQPGASGLAVVSAVRLDQLRSVDRQRLIKRLGSAAAATIRNVDQAFKASRAQTWKHYVWFINILYLIHKDYGLQMSSYARRVQSPTVIHVHGRQLGIH